MVFMTDSLLRFLRTFAFWSPFSGQCLANRRCAFGIGNVNSFEKAVRTYAKVLTDVKKMSDGKRKEAAFDSADCFPMNSDQFRQAFLRDASLKPCVLNVFADTNESFSVVHAF